MRVLARLPDSRLSDSWTWDAYPDAPGEVREGLYVALEAEQAAFATAVPPTTEAGRILMLAERSFGELVGLLIGLDVAQLDQSPGGDEWPLRKVLEHVWLVEKSYTRRTAYALARRDDEPIDLPTRQAFDAPNPAGIEAWIEALSEARAESRQFAGVADPDMTRVSTWSGLTVDVRFRLHRFSSHLMEHTVQCEKVLAALGHQPTEAARIVRRICAIRGVHEQRSSADVLANLDRLHATRLPAS
jgi:DinB superfamily